MEPDSSTPGRASGRSTQGFTGSLPTPSTSSSEQTRQRMQSSSGDSEPHPPSKPILVAKYRVASPILRPTPLTRGNSPLCPTELMMSFKTLITLQSLPCQVNLGASIGAARYLRTSGGSITNPSTGTLGCYIEIRQRGKTTWEKFGLTNYHVMRPCLDGIVLHTFGALLRPPHPSRLLKDMALGTSVWKVGATSGPSHGVYSEYKVKCTLKDDAHVTAIKVDGRTVTVSKYSEQFVIIGNNRPGEVEGRFCGPGDSGAVVFNAQGEAVGFLFSGQTPDQTRAGYGLVTPIEEVFADIKGCAKDQIEDIRILMA
ncbi:uncharacterized protein NECHADRAFT_85007 [Fusarium vanettenii 77-13-4]|uniref:Peptidase S1 domain-containing protein n=1 Tax=Fusarium vanettenii (strain ATCC MYA-4622 / CBS 123669 / FGSC 9596 / NRRL 45880 / 77-13-4) TaxID=660122 RepID=C7YUQ9_FUSV7|nr:uncharacterized protein NECHADRAFT_85007 [Fusarium vanettenii 77-13-4]EEU44453.1 hypothetical protein NECHADRAFT_85007 [Fusarium vanettenii 77-13-4]